MDLVGLPSFSTYPTTGSSLSDSRDALNWEASGHSSTWSTSFYQTVGASGLTSATLHHDVTRDIRGGHAVFADVDTAYLPNWSRSLGHSIPIVGYDDCAGTGGSYVKSLTLASSPCEGYDGERLDLRGAREQPLPLPQVPPAPRVLNPRSPRSHFLPTPTAAASANARRRLARPPRGRWRAEQPRPSSTTWSTPAIPSARAQLSAYEIRKRCTAEPGDVATCAAL